MQTDTFDFRNEVDFFKVLSDIISVPSVKTEPSDHAPYGAATAAALECMLNHAQDRGLRVRNLDGRVGYAEWGDGPGMVAVLCHLDIVPPGEGWETDPYSLTRKDGLLVGRGIIDNKGPAVCSLFALLSLAESGYKPPCRIRLIWGLDEEHGCTCMDHYVAIEELPDAGFTPDASFPAIFAEKGILQFRLTGPGSEAIAATGGDAFNMVASSCSVTELTSGERFSIIGVPAHASTPEKGLSAIHVAVSELPEQVAVKSDLLMFIRRYLSSRYGIDDLVSCAHADISGTLTLNTGLLRISETESMAGVDIRYPVHSDGKEIFDEIRGKAADFGLDVQVESHLLPLFTDPGSSSMTALREAYRSNIHMIYRSWSPDSTDIPAEYLSDEPIAIGGGTYARSMPGIIAFGPVFPWEESRMHQKNESCSEKVMISSISLYRDAIYRLCETLKS